MTGYTSQKTKSKCKTNNLNSSNNKNGPAKGNHKFILLHDWRETCLLIGLICLHKSLCLLENRSELTYKLILHENQLKLVPKS